MTVIALDEPAGERNHLTYNLQDERHFHVKASEWLSTVFGGTLIQYIKTQMAFEKIKLNALTHEHYVFQNASHCIFS
jgi:hypothetical protein